MRTRRFAHRKWRP